ncbi:tryptophan halogenase family protein [Novosphingobium sp. B 225]|uniref:tryptophan halogenase family protein n=1 Tax=Novosphingobium sp. B 225 TaxID=1961849 RepID=UPI000B4AAD79|nr:tryptophan halogenase family protein [Novosphingobium sp. B 225]
MTPIRKILIAGGGSSGWMTAALLARLFQGLYEIVLVESDQIGTIGVGEATIPAIKKYTELLGLDEDEFIARTQASFKLGIQFVDWWKQGSSYIHGFGVIGQDWEWLRMHHYWLKAHQQGRADDFAAYSINTAAALENKFLRAQTQMGDSPLSEIGHAFHFDAALFARFLSAYAQERGVRRREGKITDVTLRPDDGFIDSVTMQDGEVIKADLFVDCSGFRGLFINQALGVPFEDWSHWLPCDRAIAVPCERSENFTPYTRSTAHGAGWQWRIPLQHRTGNGHVFSSRFMDDAEAERILLSNLDGAPRADPFKVDFKAGKRKELWHKNCVAVGLAGGFLEPLESTSLHLVQAGIIRMVRLLPDAGFDAATIAEFNRQTDFEYERIRDFIILHYKATERDDTPFWDYCRTMDVPDTLQRKVDLWMANGRIFREDEELFAEESWIQVFLGQGWVPRGYDPLVDIKSDAQIAQYLSNIAAVIGKCVKVMPSHAEYVAKTCPAPAA